MKKYFVTGTDTGCGKTYITCNIVRHIQNEGFTVRALKPVASGCEAFTPLPHMSIEYIKKYSHNGLVNEDVTNIIKNDLTEANYADICGWLFREPIAPHIAAGDENVQLSADEIASFCQNPDLEKFDYILIEGAGGLMVPLNFTETWLDLLKQLKIAVILVVGMRLGCINHALLTINALKTANVSVAGWIANSIDPNMLRLKENISTLQKFIPYPLLGVVDYNAENILDFDLRIIS